VTNRRGPFAAGDRVQLIDPKGRIRTIVLRPGGTHHTHRGALDHDQLLGLAEGSVVTSAAGTAYLALRPRLVDWLLAMPRGAQVIYPKDVAQVIAQADIFPGARVLEAGAGSGALSCALLRAVGAGGGLVSWELREDFAQIAQRNVEAFFDGPHPAWTLRVGDVAQETGTGFDRVVLDLLEPWVVLPVVASALLPGGVFVGYVTTTTQLSELVEGLRGHGGFTEPQAWESLVRDWHVAGLAVRPEHRMIGHTAFLVYARRLAPGVTGPARRRRPGKGLEAYAQRRARPEPPGGSDGPGEHEAGRDHQE
jgi:tRNA (adenine57-N1/adenine58-N1)-methyltransferase